MTYCVICELTKENNTERMNAITITIVIGYVNIIISDECKKRLDRKPIIISINFIFKMKKKTPYLFMAHNSG